MLNPPPLVGLVGKARSGKDSATQIAQALRPGKICRVAFADALKAQVAATAGVSVEFLEANKELFRTSLQDIGILMRRLYGADFWSKRVSPSIDTLRTAGKAVFVPDVRFLNEVPFIRSKGGIIVRIVRPHFSSDVPNHVSETEQDSIQADLTLEAATLQELHPQVEALLRALKL